MRAQSVKLKAAPGDRVRARNYRKRPPVWEEGAVLSVETRWYAPDPTAGPRAQRLERDNAYSVMLDRRAKRTRTNRIVLYVGDDGIEREAAQR